MMSTPCGWNNKAQVALFAQLSLTGQVSISTEWPRLPASILSCLFKRLNQELAATGTKGDLYLVRVPHKALNALEEMLGEGG